MVQLKVVKCPNDVLSLTNCLVVSSNDFDTEIVKYVEIVQNHKGYVYSTVSGDVFSGSAGFSYIQRKWTGVALNSPVEIVPYKFRDNSQLVTITVDVDFFQKSKTTPESFDTEKMSEAFTEAFFGQPMSESQPVVFKFMDKPLVQVVIKNLEVLDMSMLTSGKSSRKGKTGSETTTVSIGVITRNTQILFERAENSVINLTGKARGKAAHQSLISSNWDFTDLGIGGLDKEFTNIVRRAFATRIFPAEVVEKMGLRHVKGILLHGPPGTGKTLMARQLGKMLNTREPQIISGPEILNKYVGESEANIRKLFAAAEEEQKKFGDQSALHLIIFDEFDAVCKSRYMYNQGGTGVQDSVVNQLLAKIDGVEQLNNVLLIGMTNRRDLIDDALLRPGRLEVQVEIGLPDEVGRVQILQIHTAKMKEHDLLACDVNLEDIASKTKNFSGAELEGLVRAAQATAMNKFIDIKSNFEVDPSAIGKICVTHADFEHSIDHDVKPAFGSSDDNLDVYISGGIIRWSSRVQDILDDGNLLLQQTREQDVTMPVSVLIEGPVSSGKTALAIKLALESDFPFVKLCTPENMIGFTESAKCQNIKKIFDDADKSHLSCIVIDDIERLLDFVPIGMRFSNTVLQALLVLLKKKLRKDRKLLIIGTTSCRDVLDQMSLVQAFTKVIHVPNLTKKEHLRNVLQEMDLFKPKEIEEIERGIGQRILWVGIKKVQMLAEMAFQTKEDLRVNKFLTFLEDENCLRDSLS